VLWSLDAVLFFVLKRQIVLLEEYWIRCYW